MKTLYILAGCNGAGKTTAAYALLPNLLDYREFVNVDGKTTGPSAPPGAAGITAKRIQRN